MDPHRVQWEHHLWLAARAAQGQGLPFAADPPCTEEATPYEAVVHAMIANSLRLSEDHWNRMVAAYGAPREKEANRAVFEELCREHAARAPALARCGIEN